MAAPEQTDLARELAIAGQCSNPNVAKIAMDQQTKRTDVVEPQVVSEDLLIRGVEEPVRHDGEPWEPIDFPKVTSLKLSWKNIIEVANLNNFNMLTTLRLDNNIIEKIENLDHLKQLTWLDLSFNNIQKIEGLDKLENLQDLSLYNNHIEEIGGLDGCPKLNILSLGQNQIKELRQIDYLRKFQNLRCLTLDGNKVTTLEAYTSHVFAYLPTLTYLDYMLIDRKVVAQAQEGYNLDELTEVREREALEAAKQKARKDKEKIIEKLKGQFLDTTEGYFEELFNKEHEQDAVTVLTCYAPLREDFKEKLNEEIKTLRTDMEAKNAERMKKVNAFESAINKAEKESEEEAFQAIRDFRSHKKQVLERLKAVAAADDPAAAEALTKPLLDQLGHLERELMDKEIMLQDSISEAMDKFDSAAGVICTAMSQAGSQFLAKVEEINGVFQAGLQEGMNSEIEAYSQSPDIATDHDQNKAKYFQNKDDMVNAVNTFIEANTTLIQTKGDQMEEQIKAWHSQYSERHKERQYHRNRQRVMDIKKVVDDFRAEIMAAADAGDYDDEGDGGGDPYGH